MREMLKRLERLESETQSGSVFLIRWICDPHTAQCQGERINRAQGERVEAFKARAVERFRRPDGPTLVWMDL